MRRAISTLVALAGCLACTTGAGSVHQPSTVADDIVVGNRHWVEGLALRVGQTFRVPRPIELDEWTLAYATDVLRILTPADRRRRPGPAGWRFEAIARGETDATFTGVVAQTAGGASNVPRFTLSVRVQ